MIISNYDRLVVYTIFMEMEPTKQKSTADMETISRNGGINTEVKNTVPAVIRNRLLTNRITRTL